MTSAKAKVLSKSADKPASVMRAMACMICVVCVLALSSTAMALSANEQGALNQAQSALKSASADLASARSSAGSAANPATGSRLRLTQMRLSSANQRIEQASKILSQLPADEQLVKDVVVLRDVAAKTAREIEAIISPGSSSDSSAKQDDKQGDKQSDKQGDKQSDNKGADAGSSDSKTGDAAKAPAAEKKVPRLHYQDEGKLKDARFHLRDAQGKGNAVAKVIEQIDDEKTNVVYGQVILAINTLNTAQEKLNLSYKTLEPLPSDHPKIMEAMKEVRSTNDNFGAMRERLKAEYLKLDKLANLKHYPNYDKDLALISELSRRYRDFKQTMQQPEELIQVIKEDGAALKEIQRIAKTYLPLVEQKTDAGEKMENQFNYFMSQRKTFANELVEYRKGLPAALEADIDSAMKIAQQGVNEKKPMFFGPNSGIEQQLGFAQTKLNVLEAFGKEAAAPQSKKLADARAAVKEMASSLSQEIINSNTLPADNYKGDDRAKIIEVAKDGWSYQQKDAQVLMVRIPAEAWKRTTKWEWFAGSFEKVDYSRIQVQLIIKRDDKTAVVQPVNVRMDHLEGDKLIGSPMRSGDEEVQPHSILLLEKVK